MMKSDEDLLTEIGSEFNSRTNSRRGSIFSRRPSVSKGVESLGLAVPAIASGMKKQMTKVFNDILNVNPASSFRSKLSSRSRSKSSPRKTEREIIVPDTTRSKSTPPVETKLAETKKEKEDPTNASQISITL